MTDLPQTCDCGCERTVHKNSYFDEICEVEYDLHCEKCDRYLGHFVYGNWEY